MTMNLREIASRAKVSIATVSRTINRVPTVRPALARLVQKVIEEVGYYPNVHTRALVSGRSHIFSLVISEISEIARKAFRALLDSVTAQRVELCAISAPLKQSSSFDIPLALRPVA